MIDKIVKFQALYFFVDQFLPLIFAFDHVHYACWLYSHYYDMEMLKETNSEIYQQFDDN